MKFEKAFEELMKGKRIRRKEWDNHLHLLFKDNDIKSYHGEITVFYNKPSILISHDWLVVDEDYKLLTFMEAVEQMKAKKRITNKKWLEEGSDKYITISDNQFVMCKSVEFDFMPTYQCLIANDWEVI
jgi:hypothetical protein